MQLEKAEKIIQQHNAQKNALIAMLQDVQNEFSYLPQDVLNAYIPHYARTPQPHLQPCHLLPGLQLEAQRQAPDSGLPGRRPAT